LNAVLCIYKNVPSLLSLSMGEIKDGSQSHLSTPQPLCSGALSALFPS